MSYRLRCFLRICPVDEHQAGLRRADHILIAVPLSVNFREFHEQGHETLYRAVLVTVNRRETRIKYLLHPSLVRWRRVTVDREEI